MACLVILLMSVNLELQFLAAQIAQKNLYKLGRGSRSGCQGSGNQVREESWGREGTSLCSIGYVCTVSNSSGAGGAFALMPRPAPGLVLHSKRFPV